MALKKMPLRKIVKNQILRKPKPHLAAELFEKMGKPGWALRNRLAHSGKNRSFYKTPQGGIAVLSEN
ncbi:MAG: hypothetical protein Q7R70_00660, partial [Candidatus Diapherotrites archaeon]|nr:hypothetical protein [Candidatus Diapherotrites archaeon]